VTLHRAVHNAVWGGGDIEALDDDTCGLITDDVLAAIRQWLSDQGGDLLEPTDDGWRAVKAEVQPWEWDDYDRPLLCNNWTHRADLPDDPAELRLVTLTPVDSTKEATDG
jgi:hypothetical protein